MQELIAKVIDRFTGRFKETPLVVASPGRVNLIGEHTDYNEGFVLPGATDKVVVFALSPRSDENCHFISYDFNQEFRCDFSSFFLSPLNWPNYLQGVVEQLLKTGCALKGFNCVFGGNIPIAAGMSSSAALEAGLAFGLNELFKLKLDQLTLVKLAQKAENEFVGVQCGIMDQFINIHGREKTVLKLDCRSLGYEYYPFERDDVRIIVADTLVRRELAGSEYNVRRNQCEQAVNILKKYYPAVKSLRDVTMAMLESHRSEFDPVIWRRASYIVQENIRVEQACLALSQNDFRLFGELMNRSHAGLRDDYEVSSAELNLLVEAALKVNGVFGSRMMGAGFGGCTISLVETEALTDFQAVVTREYEQLVGRSPHIYVIKIEAGTRLIK